MSLADDLMNERERLNRRLAEMQEKLDSTAHDLAAARAENERLLDILRYMDDVAHAWAADDDPHDALTIIRTMLGCALRPDEGDPKEGKAE